MKIIITSNALTILSSRGDDFSICLYPEQSRKLVDTLYGYPEGVKYYTAPNSILFVGLLLETVKAWEKMVPLWFWTEELVSLWFSPTKELLVY